MDEKTNDSDLSFLDSNASNPVQFKDILLLLLRNIHWIILCGIIGAVVSFYFVRSKERIYGSTATIMLKSFSSNGSESSRESALISEFSGMSIAISSINNEIMIMSSQSVISEMVRNLELNMQYSYKTKVAKRTKDLFGDSPIKVVFPDVSEENAISLEVIPVNDNMVSLTGFGNSDISSINVKLGDTVYSPFGRVSVQKTWYYNESFYNVPISVHHLSVSNVAEIYRKKIIISRDDTKNTVIRLSLRDTSPVRAAEVLNGLVKAYNDDAVKDQKRLLKYSYDYIDDRIAYLENDLTSIEKEIISFKKENLLLNIDNYGESYLQSSLSSNEEEKKWRMQLSMARYILDYISNNKDGKLIPINSTLENEPVLNLLQQYNSTVLELDQFAKNDISFKHPRVESLMESQEAMKGNIISLLESFIVAVEDKIEQTKKVGSEAEMKMQSVPEQQRYYASVERVQNIKLKLYESLLARREEMYLAQPAIEASAKIVDPAFVNLEPVYPNEKKSTMMGLLLGLALPSLLLVLIKLFDTRIHNKDDLEHLTKIPFLGEVPLNKKLDKNAIVITENSHDSVSEAFRMIRSNMSYMNDKSKKCQVVMFTSFFVSSGKTFMCSNLALSFALANKKVLIIDLDIRKGTMAKVFGVKARMGISSYLGAKTDDVEEILQHNIVCPNLDVVFSGPIPPNPAELLMSDRLDSLIAQLRERYDYIFLDNVPVGVVADADIIKRLADITVFVVAALKVDRGLVKELDAFYKSKKFPNLALVLNSVRHKKHKGYGSYGSYSYYGYGYGNYGYGSDETDSKMKRWFHMSRNTDAES
jgi:capsular exopolysaccharide family